MDFAFNPGASGGFGTMVKEMFEDRKDTPVNTFENLKKITRNVLFR